MDSALITLGVLAVAAFFFATEIIPLAVTAMGASIALGLLGVLTPSQVFSGLSNSTVVLFAGMFCNRRGNVPDGAGPANRYQSRKKRGY